jgi:SAM-dependent methyltransferase
MPGAETFRAPAEAYDRFVGRYGADLAAALIAFAGVEPGMRALDVGCGPGALTAALAERVGPGSVAGAEPSEGFAEACRERVPGAEIVVAGAEELPLPDGAFELWLSASLRDVRSGSLVARASYSDFEDLWAPLPTGIGPAGAFCKSLDDERRAELREAYRRRLGVGDAPFELSAVAWAVAGTAR